MDAADATPDLPSWSDEAAYAILAQADRATFAWEFGRRKPGIGGIASAVAVPIAPHIALIEAAPPTPLPGLCFALAPADGAAIPAVQWNWTCDPTVLPVSVVPDAGGFDLRAQELGATVMRGGNAEHILIADGPYRLRLAVLDGTMLDGPVRFRYHLPSGHDRAHIMALRRLMALREIGRLPALLCLPSRRAARWATVLRVWDAHRAGASQRAIACLLWGAERVREDWNGRSDYLRMRVHRMIHTADHLVRGGWQSLLR
jgi:hypothetical protein